MTARRAASLACAGLLALVGCSSSAAPGPAPAPDATGELRQSRSDALRRLVQVTVTTRVPLEVRAVRLDSAGFAPLPPTPLEIDLPAGARTDLPTSYGRADCSTEPAGASAVVVVRDGDGNRELEVPLEDHGLLDRLHAAECFERRLAEQVRITATTPRPAILGPGRPSLTVLLHLQRRATGRRVVLQDLGAHVVFTVRTAVASRPLLVLEPEQRSAELPVELVPSRCEAHALIENKRMALLGVYLALDHDPPRLITITPDAATQAALLAFAGDGCRAS